MKGRVVVIGLDGARWTLLDKFIQKGVMPNLESVRDSGTHGVLESTVPPSSLPAWPSMVTGQNPGKHGIFDLGGPLEVANPWPVYDLGPWHILEDRKLCFINVPGTYPLVEKGLNGYVVSGLFTPSGEWEDLSSFTYPAAFGEELEGVVDDYMIDLWILEAGNLPKRAERAVENRAAITKYVLEQKDVDMLWTVFTSSDRLMHKFWAYQDENHPLYDSVAEDAPERKVLEEHFAQIDRKLGEIIELLDEDDYLFILSDHGFQGIYQGLDLEKLLHQEGYIEKHKNRGKSLVSRLGIHGENAEKLFRIIGGEAILNRGSKALRMNLKYVRQKLPSPGENVEVDKSNSRILFGSSGHTLQVNTEENGGPVPDIERESIRDRLIQDLIAVRDDHALEGPVMATDEVWHGPKLSEIPDLYWFFENVEGQDIPGNDLVTSIDNVTDGSGRTYTAGHHPDGIYAVKGPGVAEGEERESLYNVVPTITALLKGVVPTEADGDVLASVKEVVGDVEELPVKKDIDGVDI